MTCEHAHLDAAYVLGSLSPTERQEFERHLDGCAECSLSVRELAGLPGLLAHVSVADLDEEDRPSPPPTVLPALVREVRAAQRRRSIVVAAVAAGVAALAVGGLALGGALDAAEEAVRASSPTVTTSSSPTTEAPPTRPMKPVGASPVSADVSLASVPWGTRLDVNCSYEADEEEYEAPPDATYVLVVRTRDGRVEQVASWHGIPGRTMQLSAATATRRGDIASLEMRTTAGLVVLRLPV